MDWNVCFLHHQHSLPSPPLPSQTVIGSKPQPQSALVGMKTGTPAAVRGDEFDSGGRRVSITWRSPSPPARRRRTRPGAAGTRGGRAGTGGGRAGTCGRTRCTRARAVRTGRAAGPASTAGSLWGGRAAWRQGVRVSVTVMSIRAGRQADARCLNPSDSYQRPALAFCGTNGDSI